MGSIEDSAINGFNDFLREQQSSEGDARITLLLFNDQNEKMVDGVPIAEMVSLTKETYTPDGMTALCDAVAKGIDDLGSKLAALPEDERPGAVVVAILTDGLENSSRHFTAEDVKSRIRHQTEKYNWQFLFLGANQDAVETAGSLGIDRGNSATFCADAVGIQSSHIAMSRKIHSHRKRMSGKMMTAEEQADYVRPMTELLGEEDEKRRKDS